MSTSSTQKKIWTLGEKETYKYFGILEADTMQKVDINLDN